MGKAIIVPSAGGGDLEPKMAALSAIFEQLQGGTTMEREDARFLLNLRLVEMGCLLIVNVVEGRQRFCTTAAAALFRFSRPITAIDLRSRSSASCSFLAAIMDWEIAASCDDDDDDRDTKLPHRFLLHYGYEHDWLFLRLSLT